MRKVIDAHVHIVPADILGSSNEHIEYQRNGRAILKAYNNAVFQSVPDIIGDSSFTAETVLAVMKNAGVEKGIIMQGAWPHLSPETVAAVRAHPDIFRGAMGIDPCDPELLTACQFAHRLGLSVIKLVMADSIGFTSQHPDIALDDARLMPVWAWAEQQEMTVAIDAGPIGNRGYCTAVYRKLVKAFPALHFVFCHLGLPFPGMHEDAAKYAQWQELCALAEYGNVWFECSALSTFYLAEAYPFPSAQQIVREFIDAHGAEKVLWGSDMPGTLSDATYRQLIDTYERSTLFSEAEKDRLFWQNAVEAYRL